MELFSVDMRQNFPALEVVEAVALGEIEEFENFEEATEPAGGIEAEAEVEIDNYYIEVAAEFDTDSVVEQRNLFEVEIASAVEIR